MADNSQQIQTNGLNPEEMSTGAGTVRAVPIAGQIAADRYGNARPAAKTQNWGLRFMKILPAGPVSDQQGTNPSVGGSSFDLNADF